MKNCNKKIKLATILAKRLYPLTAAISILISLGIPITYYALELNGLKRTAKINAEELAHDFSRLILGTEKLWKYQSAKYTEILSKYAPNQDIASIEIRDLEKRSVSIYKYENIQKGWLGKQISYGSAPIIFNNKKLGTIEIGIAQKTLIKNTFLLLIVSTATGISLGMIVYRFPVRIAKALEEKTQKLFEALQKSNQEAENLKNIAERSEKRFRDLVEGLDAIVWEKDLKAERFSFISQRSEEIIGYPSKKLLTDPDIWLEAIHPEDRDFVAKIYRGEITSKKEQIIEYRAIAADGKEVWLRDSIQIVADRENQPELLRGVMVDISDRKIAEQQLEHNALYDGLTGLFNRPSIVEKLANSIALAAENDNYKFAVLFLDLDRFKIINDSLGHLVGDRLLIGIAERLRSTLRSQDKIGRLGGDEFLILLEDIADITEAIKVAARIQSDLSIPFILEGYELVATTSIGIASSASHYRHAEELLRDADAAMYRAKAKGKNRYELFDRSMHDRAKSRLKLENDLRRAIESNEFILYYQPIVSLENLQPIGFEALIRWQHPEKGLIAPDSFIPVAEENGAIVKIGEIVLQEACRQMFAWKQKFSAASPLSISVNISSQQFSQPNLSSKIANILAETGLDGKDLTLEITENTVIQHKQAATAKLWELRELGIKLAIDDFGTGYSSLSYLSNYPFDNLKIDRSFVRDMEIKHQNLNIVKAIVSLGNNLGMNVIAEGIETPDRVTRLKNLQCRYGQGYFFSRPLEVEAVEELLLLLNPSTASIEEKGRGRITNSQQQTANSK